MTGAERVREGQAATALRGFPTTPFLPARKHSAHHYLISQPHKPRRFYFLVAALEFLIMDLLSARYAVLMNACIEHFA